MNAIVIIPCRNEAQTIQSVISSILDLKLGLGIIVVDNDSSDNTSELASSMGVRVIHETRLGKGYAFRRAIRDVDSDAVVMIDGDGTYDVRDIPPMLDKIIEGADMVIAKRVAISNSSYPLMHSFGNRFFSSFQKYLFNSKVEDSLSGFRAFSKGFIASFSLDSKGFELETDLNAHAFVMEANVINIESNYRERPANSHSKLSTIKDGFRIFFRSLNLLISWRPVFFASCVCIPIFLCALFLLLRPLSDYIEFGYVYRSPSLVTALTLLIFGSLIILVSILFSRLTRIERTIVRSFWKLSKYHSNSQKWSN